MNLIGSMILLLFSMAFILLGFNSGKRKKKYVILGSFLLILFFVFSLGSSYFSINNQVIYNSLSLNEQDINIVMLHGQESMYDSKMDADIITNVLLLNRFLNLFFIYFTNISFRT